MLCPDHKELGLFRVDLLTVDFYSTRQPLVLNLLQEHVLQIRIFDRWYAMGDREGCRCRCANTDHLSSISQVTLKPFRGFVGGNKAQLL